MAISSNQSLQPQSHFAWSHLHYCQLSTLIRHLQVNHRDTKLKWQKVVEFVYIVLDLEDSPCTAMCRPNGSFFHKISLNGSANQRKNPLTWVHFFQNNFQNLWCLPSKLSKHFWVFTTWTPAKCEKIGLNFEKKFLRNGYFFFNMTLMGFKAWAHPLPYQIWVFPV